MEPILHPTSRRQASLNQPSQTATPSIQSPTPQHTPLSPPAESSAAPSKTPIDPRVALRSVLRAWLAARDAALWLLCSGTAAAEVLDVIDLSDAAPYVRHMNGLRSVALQFATQLADADTPDTTPYTVLRTELDDLLVCESPKFLLTTDSAPGSF